MVVLGCGVAHPEPIEVVLIVRVGVFIRISDPGLGGTFPTLRLRDLRQQKHENPDDSKRLQGALKGVPARAVRLTWRGGELRTTIHWARDDRFWWAFERRTARNALLLGHAPDAPTNGVGSKTAIWKSPCASAATHPAKR